MIELFKILTEGGFVLFSYGDSTNAGSKKPEVDSFIQTVFLEGHIAKDSYIIDPLEFQWIINSKRKLIYLAAYQKLFKLGYIKNLLIETQKAFESFYNEALQISDLSKYGFDKRFKNILEILEKEESEPTMKSRRRFEDTKKFQSTLEGSKLTPSKKEPSYTQSLTSLNEADDERTNSSVNLNEEINLNEDEPNDDTLLLSKNLDAIKLKSDKFKRSPFSKKSLKTPQKPTEGDSSSKKTLKPKRTWNDKLSKEEEALLDFGEKEETISKDPNVPLKLEVASTESEIPDLYLNADDEGSFSEFDESPLEATSPAKVSDQGIFSFFKNLTGQKPLTQEDTREALKKMKENLIQKNVASDIADQVCESVNKMLIGQSIGTFQNITKLVREGAEATIRQILTPKTNMDIFMEISEAKALKQPYVIVFVGVNGVGKSTNLSKVCYWILQKRFKVLIAACDTFRSGAVEQLRVHVRNLTALNMGHVELFEKGYGKDAAGIAKEAIQYAKSHEFDAVLIDTAGRMQDNEPLMRALAKLVSINQPDSLMFVGEALVGNEAIDQLTKFNRALSDYSESKSIRKIDGIILTKFDTIDDKVGAALSMAYISKAPIRFIGTGQTYMDLKKMNVKSVVETLLKP